MQQSRFALLATDFGFTCSLYPPFNVHVGAAPTVAAYQRERMFKFLHKLGRPLQKHLRSDQFGARIRFGNLHNNLTTHLSEYDQTLIRTLPGTRRGLIDTSSDSGPTMASSLDETANHRMASWESKMGDPS